MSIRVSCLACNRSGTVPDTHAGKTVRCKCGGLIAVPEVLAWSGIEDAPPAMTQQVVIHGSQRDFPHAVHGVLTLLTCGFWLPVWVICYVLS